MASTDARVIKFRAWDTKSNEWYIGSFTLQQLVLSKHEARWLEGLVWQQFTGLHDKNGKPIYEGDILEKDGRYRAPVTYTPAMFFFEMSGNDYEPLGLFGYKFEVIGNIYEHGHLVGKYPDSFLSEREAQTSEGYDSH